MAASLSDYQNVLGYQGLVGPNPYLEYQGQIPMAGYRGVPTDAQGNPIQSFLDAQKAHDAWNAAPPPGTTLNSAPQAAQPSMLGGGGPGNPGGSYGQGGQGGSMGTGPGGAISPYPGMPASYNPTGWGNSPLTNLGGQPLGQQTAASAPAPTNPIDMRQAYLDALSNPGKVNTPGAQMLPGTTPTGPLQSNPSVLQTFLANNQASTGAGGYSNAPFFQTLNALQAQKAGAGT